ncbi:hypothetical protein FVEN_g13045 [Fusarium venenatum]|nr:hypothetical protein FVEN_g13045 [Fusarium venenatum]
MPVFIRSGLGFVPEEGPTQGATYVVKQARQTTKDHDFTRLYYQATTFYAP